MEISAPTFDWPTIGSLLLIAGTGLLVLLIGIFSKSVRLLVSCAAAGILLTFLYSLSLWGTNTTGFWGMVILNRFSLVFDFILLLSALLSLFLSIDFLKAHKSVIGEYIALICFSTFGMMVMVSAGDLIDDSSWGLKRSRSRCTFLLEREGATRIRLRRHSNTFWIGAFASGFLLYGMAYLYGATGIDKS